MISEHLEGTSRTGMALARTEYHSFVVVYYARRQRSGTPLSYREVIIVRGTSSTRRGGAHRHLNSQRFALMVQHNFAGEQTTANRGFLLVTA